MPIIIFQRLLLEAVLDIVYFPLWWYSAGLARAARRGGERFRQGNSRLAPGLWLKNIFVPMYGQFDWQGRIISFFMRLAQVIGRSVALGVWGVVCFMLWLAWLAWPVVLGYGLISSLFF